MVSCLKIVLINNVFPQPFKFYIDPFKTSCILALFDQPLQKLYTYKNPFCLYADENYHKREFG